MKRAPFLSETPSALSAGKSWRVWLVLPLSAGAGAILAYFGIGMVMTPKVVGAIRVMDPFVSTLVLLALVPAAWCSILIHEAGHLFGGIMVGMKPAFLMAGPLKLVFSGFKASLALTKPFPLGEVWLSAYPVMAGQNQLKWV